MSQRDPFDITQLTPTAFPTSYAVGYLTKPWVLEALGAEVDYAQSSNAVGNGERVNRPLIFRLSWL